MKSPADIPADPHAYLLLGGGRGDATAGPSFPTLEEALRRRRPAETGRAADGGEPAAPGPIDILCRRRDARRRRRRRPRYHFYVDARAAGGTAATARSWRPGRAWPRPSSDCCDCTAPAKSASARGTACRLSHREVFTPTAVEKWKKGQGDRRQVRASWRWPWSWSLPMLAIFAYLLVKAWPALSLSFCSRTRRTT